jgi:hypothetical protein
LIIEEEMRCSFLPPELADDAGEHGSSCRMLPGGIALLTATDGILITAQSMNENVP